MCALGRNRRSFSPLRTFEDMMGRFVIVAYKPKLGREAALLDVVAKHLQVLSAGGPAFKPAGDTKDVC
jgi:hypothetical protein